MRLGFLYIIIFFFSPPVLCAQFLLKGKVLNADTDLPLSGVSIYFNNTSLGALSNNIGEFTITNAIEGELVISSVGFERIVYKITKEELGRKSFTFKLYAKETVLQDVLIMPDATRQRYLKLFKDNFLGQTEEADMSRVINLKDIYFIKPENDKDGIIALSDTPLTIINRKLGYRVEFELAEFYLDEKKGRTSFYGFTRYNEMGERKKYDKNRRKVYYGSNLHFYRSLINDQLDKEGYSIYKIIEDSLQPGKNGININSKKMDIAFAVRAADIVKKDTASEFYTAGWGTKLMVQYNKNPAGKSYLARKLFVAGSLPNGFRSYLHMQDAGSVQIDRYGILVNPLMVYYSGYWIYAKAASMLPYNYYPEKDDE